MKKFLTVLLVGGLMAGSIFAFNANAPRVNQDPNAAPIYQNYQGTRGGYMFNEENMITVTGVIDSIEENKDFPGILEIKIKTDNGDFVEIHANSYFAKDLEIGKTIEVKGWEIEFNNEKIFRPVESKVDGKDVVLNGFRDAARGMRSNTQMPGYNRNSNFRGNMRQSPMRNNNQRYYQMQNNCYGPQISNRDFVPRGNFQMPGYQGQRQYPNQQPMPRGRW